MIQTDQRKWKAVCQEVSDLQQVNSVSGDDCIRTYLNGEGKIMARMVVYGSNTGIPGYECKRLFEVDEAMIEKSKNHYILTPEEEAEWDDFDGDDNQWLKDRGVVL